MIMVTTGGRPEYLYLCLYYHAGPLPCVCTQIAGIKIKQQLRAYSPRQRKITFFYLPTAGDEKIKINLLLLEAP